MKAFPVQHEQLLYQLPLFGNDDKRKADQKDNEAARTFLVNQYIELIKSGFPQRSLPPFMKWVAVLASQLGTQPSTLQKQIREMALMTFHQCRH